MDKKFIAYRNKILQALVEGKKIGYVDNNILLTYTCDSEVLLDLSSEYENLKVLQDLNGITIITPEYEKPTVGEDYFTPSLNTISLSTKRVWSSRGVKDDHDMLYLKRGLVHKTEIAAKLHAEAIISAFGEV